MIKGEIKNISFIQMVALLPSIQHAMTPESQSFFEETIDDETFQRYYVTYGFSDELKDQDSFIKAVIDWLHKIPGSGVKKIVWRRLPEISSNYNVALAKKNIQFSTRLYCQDKDGNEVKFSFIKIESTPTPQPEITNV